MTAMTFERFEIKYMLTRKQYAELQQVMDGRMYLDRFGHSVIRNIYYDTADWRLVRRSIEKPIYKEKFRIRSYQQARPGDRVYIELKKKYRSVVYKRRIALSEGVASQCMLSGQPLPDDSQIGREIAAFRQFYGALRPAVFLSYEREAWAEEGGGSFRATFDENIRYRTTALTLGSGTTGTPLLEDGQILMELKCDGALPLWMTRFLTEHRIYHTSFSKYGTAYQDLMQCRAQEKILPFQGGFCYA